jgi:hypothetical protein
MGRIASQLITAFDGICEEVLRQERLNAARMMQHYRSKASVNKKRYQAFFRAELHIEANAETRELDYNLKNAEFYTRRYQVFTFLCKHFDVPLDRLDSFFLTNQP